MQNCMKKKKRKRQKLKEVFSFFKITKVEIYYGFLKKEIIRAGLSL